MFIVSFFFSRKEHLRSKGFVFPCFISQVVKPFMVPNYLTAFSTGPASLVHILSAKASTEMSNSNPTVNHAIRRAHDGNLTSVYYDCYLSSTTSLAWANFSIPMSEVTKVQLAAVESWEILFDSQTSLNLSIFVSVVLPNISAFTL